MYRVNVMLIQIFGGYNCYNKNTHCEFTLTEWHKSRSIVSVDIYQHTCKIIGAVECVYECMVY